MKPKVLLITLALAGALVSCAERSPHPMDMTAAIQGANTRADHEALALHYDEVAKEMENKAEEHEKILARFEKDPHDFPKQALAMNFKNHCLRLIDIYEEAAKENLEMAATHRQMAAAMKP